MSTLDVGSLVHTPCCLYTLPTPTPLYLNVGCRTLHVTCILCLPACILSYSAWADTLSYVAPPPPLPAPLTGDWGKSVHNVVFQRNNAARQSTGCSVLKCIDGQTMRSTVMTQIVDRGPVIFYNTCLSWVIVNTLRWLIFIWGGWNMKGWLAWTALNTNVSFLIKMRLILHAAHIWDTTGSQML